MCMAKTTVYRDSRTGRFVDTSSPIHGKTHPASIERLVEIVKESNAIIKRHENDFRPPHNP